MSRNTSSSAGGEKRQPRKVRKVVTLEWEDEEMELLKQTIEYRRENERKRLELERARLELGSKKAEERRKKQRKDHELEEKRLEI